MTKSLRLIWVSLGLALTFILLGTFFTGCTKRDIDDPKHKIMYIPITDDAKTLDPANAYDQISLQIMPLTMESLFQYKYLKTPLELEPLLADGMPVISKDKKTYTIKIKKGVMFQDDAAFPDGKGRELKAKDFVYAWKRLLVPKLQSSGTWIFEDKVIGYSELKKRFVEDKTTPVEQLINSDIDGFKALDDYTIQIKLIKPYPQILYVLAMGFGAPVASEVIAKYGHDGLTERMVGTGPFMLKSVVRGSKITLLKSPSFRGELYPNEGDDDAKARGLLAYAGKPLPFVDEMQFHIHKEEQPAWLKLQKGQLDVGLIPKDNFSTAILGSKLSPEMEKKGMYLQKQVEAVIWYMNFNMKDKILGTNANLRKAIVRAVDRDYWIELFTNGRGIKATSTVPVGIAGHIERPAIVGDFNLEEAKQYLAKAGYPEGKGLAPIRFDLRGASPTIRQQGEYMTKALAKIGVQLQVESNTFPAFLEKAKQGNLQFFLGGWIADYPDAENFMQLLYGKNVAPGPNDSNYSNPAFDKLYEQLATMAPSPQRDALIRKAEDLAFNDGVWSMLYYPVLYSLSHGWVKNYRPNEIILNFHKYMDVDIEQKKKLLTGF